MGNLLTRRRDVHDSPFEQREAVSQESKELARVKFNSMADKLATGDICALYSRGDGMPHYAMFVVYEELGEHTPPLLLKGKTKPLPLDKFNKSGRDVRIISASARMFYGDYQKVVIHRVKKSKISGDDVDEAAETVRSLEFSEEELKLLEDPNMSPESRSHLICTLMLSQVMSRLHLIDANPCTVTPESFLGHLTIEESYSLVLPETRPGPLIKGSPPYLAKLINGINPPSDVKTVNYDDIASTLQTGDLVLFSGATSGGAIIKLFDNAEFSHSGIILRRKINAKPLVWEASTNKAGLVDVETGKVTQGIELLPLRQKVFSGWYNRVAIRRLKVSDEQREEMVGHLLKFKKELGERPYEQKKLQLIRSALDFHEDFLTFLKNEEEDLSSLFCSELVAAAYQRMGLLESNKESPQYKTSNEYTPEDFTSRRSDEFNIKYGKLEKEIYIEMKNF